MNDFTKEELETIIDEFNFIHGAPAWRTTEGWDDKLQEKIQCMIDNYCEHEQDFDAITVSPMKRCLKCKDYYQ